MKKYLTPLTVIAMLGIAACGKDYNRNVSSDGYTLSSAMASVAVTEKVVILNATTGGTFRGNSGSRYIFPASAFKDASGNIVTGNVQVTAKEYLKKTDMIFSGVLPVSDGEPLISGGESFVSASQNGHPLTMAPGKTYQVNMPQKGTAVAGMGLFTGVQDPTTNTISWKPTSDSGRNGGSPGSIIYNGDTTSIISDSMQFTNADQFMTNPDFQSFTVTASATGITLNDSISCFALYDQYNGAWPMHPTGHIFDEHVVPNIPVHFVMMAVINGNFYGGILGATPTNGNTYNVSLTKTTPSAFKVQIDAL